MSETIIVLVVFLLNPPLVATNGQEPRGSYELASYTSRTACEIQARTVRLQEKARLRCIERDLSPDEKLAMAR